MCEIFRLVLCFTVVKKKKVGILQPNFVIPENMHPVFSHREGSEKGNELCVCRDDTLKEVVNSNSKMFKQLYTP